MTSAPIRDPLADHLITPQNSALIVIDYQPSQLAAVRSMDHDLLVKNIVSTVKAAKLFGVPVVHSTVNVAVARSRLSPSLRNSWPMMSRSIEQPSIHGRTLTSFKRYARPAGAS